MKSTQEKVLFILAFFSIYVIWGSTYLLNKIAVGQLAPFFLAGIRFVTASILIFIIAKSIGLRLKITKQQVKNTAIAGFLFLTFGNGVVVWALRFVDSGFAALEISAQPLVVLLLLRIFEGKKIKLLSIIGVFLGIVGMYLLISQEALIAKEGTVIGMIMIFACMISWGYGSLFVSKAVLPTNFFINTGYQMFFGGLFLLVSSALFNEQWVSPINWHNDVIFSMGTLIIFGSIVAFTSFNYLLKMVSPEKVATSTYVNPIIALALGWYFLDEIITLQSVIAAVVLLTGVYFINTKKVITLFSKATRRM